MHGNIGITDKLSLKNLAEVLRDKNRWPIGFRWDYSDRSRCAIGLAEELWGIDPEYAYGLTYGEVRAIFYGCGGILPTVFVTPKMVARKIERLLEKKGR